MQMARLVVYSQQGGRFSILLTARTKDMLWKSYAYLFLFFGILCSLTVWGAEPEAWTLHKIALITDILLSIAATVLVFQFAYGKRSTNLLWRGLAGSFVVVDLVYNLMINNNTLEANLIGLLVSAPAYYICMKYVLNWKQQKPAVQTIYNQHSHEALLAEIEREEDLRWAKIEAQFKEAQKNDAGETIKVSKQHEPR